LIGQSVKLEYYNEVNLTTQKIGITGNGAEVYTYKIDKAKQLLLLKMQTLRRR
jgi:hypothetical protein